MLRQDKKGRERQSESVRYGDTLEIFQSHQIKRRCELLFAQPPDQCIHFS